MNYSNMKKDELLEEAKKKGLKVSDKNTKAEIVEALESADKKAAKNEAPAKAESKKSEKKAETKPKAKKARKARKPSKKEESEFKDRESMRALKKTAASDEDSALHPNELNVMPKVYKQPPAVWMVDPDEKYTGDDNRIGLELTQTLVDPNQHVTGIVKEALRSSQIKPGEKGLFMRVECVSKDDGSVQQVYIPSNFFFSNEYNTLNEDKLHRYASLRIGSEVDLNLYKKSEDKEFYIAERQTAMRKQRCNVWYAKNGRGDYMFKVGTKVQARVVGASKTFIQVEVAGAETFITDKELSWNYIDDCRKIANVGEKIFIIITDIKRENEPARMDERAEFEFPIKFNASAKRVSEDPRETNFYNYHLGSQILATVTSIKEGQGKNTIFAYDGRYDLYCNMRAGVGLIPHVGDDVVVKITGKDEKTKNVWGEIVHVMTKKKKQGTAITIYR